MSYKIPRNLTIFALSILIFSCTTQSESVNNYIKISYIKDKLDKFDNIRTLSTSIIDTALDTTEFFIKYGIVLPTDGSIEINIGMIINYNINSKIEYIEYIDMKNRPHLNKVALIKILIDGTKIEIIPESQSDLIMEKYYWLKALMKFDLDVFNEVSEKSEVIIRIINDNNQYSDFKLKERDIKNIIDFKEYILNLR